MARKMDWFRLYPEIRRDPKIRRLDPEERWLWVTLLCIASGSPKRGHLLISDDFPYEPADIADEAALALDITEQGLDKFMKFGLLERDEDGVFYLPKWNDRQYDNPSDTPEATRERQRRSRARRKKSREDEKKVTSGEKESHNHVTTVSRPGHETESDTDTEPDTDIDTAATTAHAREGESDGVPTTDPIRGDLQPATVDAEISHTPSDAERLERRFLQRKGSGLMLSPEEYQSIDYVLERVAIDDALRLLDVCFDEFKPKYPRDSINSFKYCAKFILDRHEREKARSKRTKWGGEQGENATSTGGQPSERGKWDHLVIQ